jgi:hypothetical protein
MKDLANLARKYSGKTGKENAEISDQVLDMLQAWGEAFLPYRKDFPAFVNTYHELRKEGLPFKAQYDPSRVPLFAPGYNPQTAEGRERDHTDVILNAAISGDVNERGEQRNVPPPDSCNLMSGALAILAEMIMAANNTREIRDNDIAIDVAEQIQNLRGILRQELTSSKTNRKTQVINLKQRLISEL